VAAVMSMSTCSESKVTPAAVDGDSVEAGVETLGDEAPVVNWQTLNFVPVRSPHVLSANRTAFARQLETAMTLLTKEAIADAENVRPRRRKLPQSLYVVIGAFRLIDAID